MKKYSRRGFLSDKKQTVEEVKTGTLSIYIANDDYSLVELNDAGDGITDHKTCKTGQEIRVYIGLEPNRQYVVRIVSLEYTIIELMLDTLDFDVSVHLIPDPIYTP